MRKPKLIKKRKHEILAEMQEIFPPGSPIGIQAVLELYPEFNNYNRAFAFLNSSYQQGLMRKISKGIYTFPTDLESLSQIIKATRKKPPRFKELANAWSQLNMIFPHPNTFRYQDIAAKIPDFGTLNNIYSHVARAIARGDVVRTARNRFQFTEKFRPRTIRERTVFKLTRPVNSTDILGDIERRYNSPVFFASGSVLRPLTYFRTEIYGPSFDVGTPDEQCPPCTVIDDLRRYKRGSEFQKFDILICYLGPHEQAFVKEAGSWQFSIATRDEIKSSAA